jgi:hypothetical protein
MFSATGFAQVACNPWASSGTHVLLINKSYMTRNLEYVVQLALLYAVKATNGES